MLYRIAADAVVLFHLGFILFVLLGGLLVLRWPKLALLHLPAACWGVTVEWLHLICPLTPLENTLRRAAGEQGYEGGFIEHHVLPVIYPAGLTPGIQLWLGGIVVGLNLLVYGVLLVRLLRRAR
ncbi:DUF2784 domain-containing protein [Pseudomonas sp. PDM13]|uniref:DUF2784 domain-containing protein n=1 Tax=Pseudomonas sp. PDM13 TaxID=2769255 RepID=UPI0021DFC5C2|nr:DUF2784 domain-containing protein [Pseudomonas sp. PDM13]MCU9950493.1 DUF2784 domain-containing protein [Pseudomonas sp. PDM13]